MKGKMQILYVTTSYPPAIGGAQIHLHCLAKNIKASGNEVSIITHWSRYRNDWLWGTTFFSEKEKIYMHDGISVSQIGFSSLTRVRMLPWILTYYLLMGPAIRKISDYMLPYIERISRVPSLVHATRIGREFIVRASMNFAHNNNIPFLLTPNHHPRWRGFLYREYDKIYREADALFVLTEVEKQTLVENKGVLEERVHITGIGPMLSERFSAKKFRATFNLKERFVLYLGQQYKYKGIAAIIRAAPIVWQKHPDVKFVFAGPHTRDSYRLFRNFRDTRVLNLGPVDIETKTSALSACEFLCMPSIQESFGGVYVEAWSLRKAVIGGRIPPISCVVEDGQDSLLSSQNPNELAEVISYLLSHPSKCQAMGNAGWQKVQDKYTWDKLAKKTLEVYKKFCL